MGAIRRAIRSTIRLRFWDLVQTRGLETFQNLEDGFASVEIVVNYMYVRLDDPGDWFPKNILPIFTKYQVFMTSSKIVRLGVPAS